MVPACGVCWASHLLPEGRRAPEHPPFCVLFGTLLNYHGDRAEERAQAAACPRGWAPAAALNFGGPPHRCMSIGVSAQSQRCGWYSSTAALEGAIRLVTRKTLRSKEEKEQQLKPPLPAAPTLQPPLPAAPKNPACCLRREQHILLAAFPASPCRAAPARRPSYAGYGCSGFREAARARGLRCPGRGRGRPRAPLVLRVRAKSSWLPGG